jgi:adenylate kinase
VNAVRLLILGPPGGGKGTQSARLAERLGIEHISTGDLLRDEVARDTPLGREVAGYMERGELVPDELIIDTLIPHLQAGGFILDGFPRTVEQARALERRGIPLDAAVNLTVRAPELKRRLLGRAAAEGRADDTPEVIDNRLRVYEEQTAPVIDFYRERGLLSEVRGEQPIDRITEETLTQLGVKT